MNIFQEKDSLLELVSSLKPREKRYISIYLKQFKVGKNIYFNAFNLVSKSKKESLSINPIIKTQLYWKILKGLQLFHSENNPVILKNNLLSQIQVLNEKGLTQHALRVLKAAKKICVKNDLNEDLLNISKQEAKLIIAKNQGQAQENVISTYNKINLLQLRILNQNYSLTKIYLQNKLNSGFFKLKLDNTSHKILNAYILKQNESDILSNYGKILFNYNLGFYFLGTNDIKKALSAFQKACLLYLMNADLITIHKEEFYELLELICHTHLENAKYNLLNTWIIETQRKLEKISLSKEENDIIFSIARIGLLQAKNETKLIEKEIEHLSYLKTKTFNLKYRFEIDYQIIKTLNQLYKHNGLVRLINFFYTDYPQDYKPEVHVSLRLLNLIIIFLTKDYGSLKNEIRSTANYLYKQNINSPFAQCIITDLKLLIKKDKAASPLNSSKHLFISSLSEYLKMPDYRLNYDDCINFHIFVKHK